jgi:twinkle protein
VADLLDAGSSVALSARKITEETCAHFKYTVSGDAQIAPYFDRDGSLVAQKVRRSGKRFSWLGAKPEEVMPFGYHAFSRSGKAVVLTEGEIDALSMSQVQGNKYPVWSIPTGAGPQLKKWLALKVSEGIFEGFESVIVMFDNDETGRKATAEACSIIGAKAKVAELPLKDANEMLVAGRVKELVQAFWNAKPYRPEGIVGMADVMDEALTLPTVGLSYPWQGLTDLLNGQHYGEIVTWVAGTGVGKTDILMQIAAHNVMQHGEAMGLFLLETTPAEAAKLVVGKYAGKRFHLPNAGWTLEELTRNYGLVAQTEKLFLYDSQGSDSWESIRDYIRYLRHAHGVRKVIVDHIMALVADADDDRKAIDALMADMRKLVVELGITIHLVSHLNRPLGKAFEEGGQVSLKNLRGSGATAAWSWTVMAAERDQQNEDQTERTKTILRILKHRRDGSKVGRTLTLRYDERTGLLNETTATQFTDETLAETAGVSDF